MPYPVSDDPFGGNPANPPYAGIFVPGSPAAEPDPEPEPEPEPDPFVAVAVDFTNGHLSRATAFDGATPTNEGSCSFWLRRGAELSSTVALISSGNGPCILNIRHAAGVETVVVSMTDAEFNFYLYLESTQIPLNQWFHVCASWRGDAATLYVDGVDDLDVVDNQLGEALVAYDDIGWTVFESGAAFCMAELWLSNEYIDFTIEANREKFRSAGGVPVSLGADGSLPTGTAPMLYLPNPAATVEVNAGTGGNFTRGGTLVACDTAPGA